MNRIKRGLVAAIVVLSATVSFAQDAADPDLYTNYEQVLIPIPLTLEPFPGMNAAWQNDLVMFNRGDAGADIYNWDRSHFSIDSKHFYDKNPCPFLLSTCSAGGGDMGFYFYVRRPANAYVSFHLRSYDVLHSDRSFGTEIPIVREGDAFQGVAELLAVPFDETARVNLRVSPYGVYEVGSRSAKVTFRVFSPGSASPVVEDTRLISLNGPYRDRYGIHPPEFASGFSVSNLAAAYPVLNGIRQARIEVEPDDPTVKFFAFVTVTNNLTQQVTTITQK